MMMGFWGGMVIVPTEARNAQPSEQGVKRQKSFDSKFLAGKKKPRHVSGERRADRIISDGAIIM